MVRRISGRVSIVRTWLYQNEFSGRAFSVEKVGLPNIGFFRAGVNFTVFLIMFNDSVSNYRSYVMLV